MQNSKLLVSLKGGQFKIKKFKETIRYMLYAICHQKGFTLIELLVVISIIGVLVAGVLFIIDPRTQLQKANDTKRKTDLTLIQKALEHYYDDHNMYPQHTFRYTIYGDSSGEIKWGSNWPGYIDMLPKDKDSTKKYVYKQDLNGQAYYLYASLDRGANDPQACNEGAICANAPTTITCGGVDDICNYGVSSPNVSP